MTPNLREAFLTAGNNLQPIGDWVVDFWITFGPGLGLAIAGWICLRAWHVAIPRLTRRHAARRGIRRLENYLAHPAHRAPRKGDR